MTVSPPRARGSLLLLAYLGFVGLGVPDGLLGVGWPEISDEFGVPIAAVGLLLAVGTVGYLASSVAGSFTVARWGVGRLLAVGMALAGTALAGYALAPVFAVMVCLALLPGLGSGAVDSGLHAYAAAALGPRHMHRLHAFFGLGVAVGPLIMTAVLRADLSWRWGYAAVAAAQIALAAAFALRINAWAALPAQPTTDPSAGAGPMAARDTLRLPAVWIGAAAFAAYVAIEVGAGLWGFLLLTEARGVGPVLAGVCVSGYWGALSVGRLAFGLVAERAPTRAILPVALTGMTTATALIALPGPAGVTVAGLLLLGFSAAPVFPLLTLATADRVGAGHADRAIGVQIGAAGLGGAVIPAGIGWILAQYGAQWLGAALLVAAFALLGLYLAGSPRPRLRAIRRSC